MRDLIVTLAVFGTLPFILRYPWIGILAWSWLSYMNPHRMAWGFSTSMPFAFMVAIATFVGILFSRARLIADASMTPRSRASTSRSSGAAG